jgi:hypothetical protein
MIKTILLIEDPTSITEIKKIILQHNDLKIFSLNYLTHRILNDNNISHEIGEDSLSIAEHKMIDDKTINATTTWWNHESVRDYLIFEAINLPDLIEMEFFQYLSPIYRSAFTISKIIDGEKPDKVISVTNLNNFVLSVCKSKKIEVLSYEQTKEPVLIHDNINIKYNLGPIPISITISRTKYFLIKQLVEKIVYSIFNLHPRIDSSNEKSILLLDFNPTSYKLLLKELSKLNKHVMLLNQRRPAVWNIRSLKIVRKSKCKIINLNMFEKRIENNIRKAMEENLVRLNHVWSNDSVFAELFSINGITFWPSIKNNFIKLCNSRFLESIRRILLLDEMFNQFKISIILEWAETGQEEKEVLHVSKKFGIKSIMLQHAMFPNSKDWDPFAKFLAFLSHPVISDKQAVWGEITRDFALSHGYENENLLVTGSPRHDEFFTIPQNNASKGIILFATTSASSIASENSGTKTFEKFDGFIREVCRVSKQFPDKKLIIKPHPQADYINRVSDLVKEIDPNIKIVYEANLIDLINSCDILITNNNSTIALESIILNKPTISLQIEKWAEENDIVQSGSILSISNIDEIESSMKKIINDDAFRKNLLDNAKKFVDSYLSNQGSASKKLADILIRY